MQKMIDPEDVLAAAAAAAHAIPPVWPLVSSVAVNPFLGQIQMSLAQTSALLTRVAGVSATMPRHWYCDRIADGIVTDEDLLAAIAASGKVASLADIRAAVERPSVQPPSLPTVAHLAAGGRGTDWPGIIAERFGAWAGGYFDEGQALWAAPRGKGAYAAWRAFATHDLTPEIAGLRGFAAFVADAPEAASDALSMSVARLRLPVAALQSYFHSLLTDLAGWAQYARYKLWQATLAGEGDDTLTDLLAVRLLWDVALFEQHEETIGDAWEATVTAHGQPIEPTDDQVMDAILQDALERAEQRRLAEVLVADAEASDRVEPVIQAAFCIDVRSEVFRRSFEAMDPRIQTIGFAGFFGVAASHRRFASDVKERRFPVLLNAGLTSRSCEAVGSEGDLAIRYKARAARAWVRFKLAAVSSFAFVEAAGPIYVAKLLRDALGLHGKAMAAEPEPRFDSGLGLPGRIALASQILRAMSLTRGFARLVLLVGHGANVVNNPHASSLHCGACGGYPGDVNARLLAGLLNDQAVRKGLYDAGIVIPEETLFIGALHDTTTDAVEVFAEDYPFPAHALDIARVRKWLAAAGALARGERALHLPRAKGEGSIARRSRDWAEVRPEWALTGCKAFIAAPRRRTAGRNLQGRAFLHDYDWRVDGDFRVLEQILTAPVVVASWISLQYYGSTVAPSVFGGGNKLLHNVIGGIGIVEGNGGKLRAGLPWQSVHDGRRFVHEPLRLTVCIEAPCEAISAVLERHPEVRALFENGWLHLFALDDAGHMAWRYAGDLHWNDVREADQPASSKAA